MLDIVFFMKYIVTMEKLDTPGKRLRFARSRANLSTYQLAEKVGVSQASISRLERGIDKSSRHIFEICLVLRVRPEWLAKGEGEMEDNVLLGLSDNWARLSESQREIVNNLITSLANMDPLLPENRGWQKSG